MKTILLLEVKDNKTIATLTKVVNGKNNLIMHNVYNSKPLKGGIALFDETIATSVKRDVEKIISVDKIDETFLTINDSRTHIETRNVEFKYNSDVEQEQIKFAKMIVNETKAGIKVVAVRFSKSPAILTKINVKATIEYVEVRFMNEIKNKFQNIGIKINGLIPVVDAITKSFKNTSINQSGVSFNTIVEDGYTMINVIKDGAIQHTTKWTWGLSNIYDHIAMAMTNISRKTAKTYFDSFGSIPPESVIDDKVIHTVKEGKTISVFTKKDLSRAITEKVNSLFENVKNEYNISQNEFEIDRLTFSGEIKSLTGFKTYASKSFAKENIKNISTNVIGLTEGTEFITNGLMIAVLDRINLEETYVSDNNKTSFNLLNKIARLYNYI